MSVSLLQLFESTLSNASIITRNMEAAELLSALQLCISLQTTITELLGLHLKHMISPTPSNGLPGTSLLHFGGHTENSGTGPTPPPLVTLAPAQPSSAELAKVVSSLVSSLNANGAISTVPVSQHSVASALSASGKRSAWIVGSSKPSNETTSAITSLAPILPASAAPGTSTFNVAEVLQRGKLLLNSVDSQTSVSSSMSGTHANVLPKELSHVPNDTMKAYIAKKLKKRKRMDDLGSDERAAKAFMSVYERCASPATSAGKGGGDSTAVDDPSSSADLVTIAGSSGSSTDSNNAKDTWLVLMVLLSSPSETLAPPTPSHVEQLTAIGLGRSQNTDSNGLLALDLTWGREQMQQFVTESWPLLRRRRRPCGFTYCVGDPGSSLIPLTDWNKVSDLRTAHRQFYSGDEELSSTAYLYVRPTDDINPRDVHQWHQHSGKHANQKSQPSKAGAGGYSVGTSGGGDSAKCSSCAISFPDYLSFVEHIQQVHVFGAMAREHRFSRSNVVVSPSPRQSKQPAPPSTSSSTSAGLVKIAQGPVRGSAISETGKAGRRGMTGAVSLHHLYKLTAPQPPSQTSLKPQNPPSRVAEDASSSLASLTPSSTLCVDEEPEEIPEKHPESSLSASENSLELRLLASLQEWLPVEPKVHLVCSYCHAVFQSAQDFVTHLLKVIHVKQEENGSTQHCFDNLLGSSASIGTINFDKIGEEQWLRAMHFECAECLSWRVSVQDLETHLQHCSLEQSKNSGNSEVRLCPVCEKAFANLTLFSIHLRKDHQSFYCEKCGLIETNRGVYLQHCKECTGVGDTVDET